MNILNQKTAGDPFSFDLQMNSERNPHDTVTNRPELVLSDILRHSNLGQDH